MNHKKPIPIILLTGFLGAGKTTWLSQALKDESNGQIAVLVNEFGEVGIDHLVLGEIAPDTVLLNSGCVCCQIRGELKHAILDLISRSERGEIPAFEKIVIETTGLADPAQIHSTLIFDPVLHNQVLLQDIVTIADAQNSSKIHALQPEWVAQIAAASLILFSKIDLVTPLELQSLKGRLALINPTARQRTVGDCPRFSDIGCDANDALLPSYVESPAAHRDGTGAQTLALSFDTQIDWIRFVVWLSAVIHCHGDKLLRVKCILNTTDTGRVLIDGVGHMLHHPRHLKSKASIDEKSHLVFIARDLDMERLRASFDAFIQAKEAEQP